MPDKFSEKTWVLDGFEFDSPEGYTPLGDLAGGATTNQIKLPGGNLGFDKRLLPGSHVKIGDYVFGVKRRDGDLALIEGTVRKDKTKKKTRVQRAKRRDCNEPKFGVTAQITPVTMGFSPLDPVSFLCSFQFTSDVPWESFSGVATLTALFPSTGLVGVWASEAGAGWSSNIGSKRASFSVKLRTKQAKVLETWTLKANGYAFFADNEAQRICGGEQQKEAVLSQTGLYVISGAVPPPA